MNSRGWTARAVLAALGALGIAIAHSLAYMLVARDAHTHHELLHSTGHRYWPLGGALLVAFLVATIGFGMSTRFGRRGGRSVGLIRGAGILAVIQVSGFLLMEAGERLLFTSDHALGSLLSEPVIWVGVALQGVVAVVGALVLRTLLRVVAFIQTRTRRPHAAAPKQPQLALRATSWFAPALSPTSGGLSRRGPPSLTLI